MAAETLPDALSLPVLYGIRSEHVLVEPPAATCSIQSCDASVQLIARGHMTSLALMFKRFSTS
jgi:hypothetical protein